MLIGDSVFVTSWFQLLCVYILLPQVDSEHLFVVKESFGQRGLTRLIAQVRALLFRGCQFREDYSFLAIYKPFLSGSFVQPCSPFQVIGLYLVALLNTLCFDNFHFEGGLFFASLPEKLVAKWLFLPISFCCSRSHPTLCNFWLSWCLCTHQPIPECYNDFNGTRASVFCSKARVYWRGVCRLSKLRTQFLTEKILLPVSLFCSRAHPTLCNLWSPRCLS